MRHLGTLMLLASAAMLLFPSLWEGRWPFKPTAPGVEQPAYDLDRSTLRPDDLLPPWRGPRPQGEKDG
jgi:hypothetical protein